METNSHIYLRRHKAYDEYDVYKLGRTDNTPERDDVYSTGEVERGEFISVYEVPSRQVKKIERDLQYEFCNMNVRFTGGREFYKKEIAVLIEPYFLKNEIKYRKLEKNEIDALLRKHRIQKIRKEYEELNNSMIQKRERKYVEQPTEQPTEQHTEQPTEQHTEQLAEEEFIPRPYQEPIIHTTTLYLTRNSKGILQLPCGIGKTLISLWTSILLNSMTIIIGVPNVLLLDQWRKIVIKMFNNVPYLLVSGNKQKEDVIEFLQQYPTKGIVITTYASSHKVLNATNDIGFKFDMKINDEVHHLTSHNTNEKNKKKFINMLQIDSEKQLSLTATIKILENSENKRDDEVVISNDNIELFGEIIDRKTLLWAIQENVVCDYVIQTIITNEEQLEDILSKFNITDENDKRLFLSAYASLKSIHDGHSHHMLIYSNNTDNSEKIISYVNLLLDNQYFIIRDLYYSSYHSELKQKIKTEILTHFNNAGVGIISCVYCLGEGYDNCIIDAVVFAENMSSNIRIVQSALRASRKNSSDKNKKTKIILPILNRDDWMENNENPDLKKVREVIYQMGLEDETISYKIKVFRIEIRQHLQPLRRETNSQSQSQSHELNDFGEYDQDLTRKLRLKTVKRNAFGITYEKARKIIADKNLTSKEAYYELCERDNRLTIDPETDFKGKFTNWIEYLSIKRVYYDLETCKHKIGKYLSLYPEIKQSWLNLENISNELCKIDERFPPNGLWVEYYGVKDLRDIIIVINNKKKLGIIL